MPKRESRLAIGVKGPLCTPASTYARTRARTHARKHSTSSVLLISAAAASVDTADAHSAGPYAGIVDGSALIVFANTTITATLAITQFIFPILY